MSGTKSKHSTENEEIKAACYGPALPPHLFKKRENNSPNQGKEHKLTIGPVLPPPAQNSPEKNNIVGPQVSISACILNETSNQDKDLQPEVFGPALPPSLERDSIGPKMPSPNIAVHSKDEEDTYGPLPPDANRLSSTHIALEERALYLKMEQLEPNQDKPPVREEWMLELPQVEAAKFGLGPRQFRSKEGPDMSDRSSWTKVAGKSTAKNKITKVDLKKEAELRELDRRDKEQEKMAKRHKRKDKSLLESHQDKIKQKKKEEGPAERRPFSREVDLQVNRFDEAQKKAVLKKAELLDDRFSSGKSKYL